MILFHPWNNKRRAFFLEQLSSYLRAGIPLDRTLEIIAESSSRNMRPSLGRIREDVIKGLKISTSLATHIHLQASLVGLIEHGELSGSLATAVDAARQVIERTTDMFRKCISALVYPGVIACFSLILIIGLVRGVMPQITPMLKSLRVPLPFLTRSMMTITDMLMNYGIWLAAGMVIGGIGIITLYIKVTPLRRFLQHIFKHLPLIGRGMSRYIYSVFLRSLGSLISSGMSVPDAFDRTVSAITFLPLQNTLKRGSLPVHAGTRLSQVFKTAHRDMPVFIPSLISAGEASAALGPSLIRCADLIDQEIDQLIKRLTSLIEPVMMAGMGGIVGSVALSIMLPIYDISKTLQH